MMPDMDRRFGLREMVIAGAALAASCTYSGSVDNPVLRKATWFSYVGGEDIRRDCRPGDLARYRLVYNAIWDEQVRAYDLLQSATGEGALLFATVFKGGGLDIVQALSPGAGRWGGERADRRLDEATYRDLVAAIERSGLNAPSPDGLRLYSFSFFWVAMGCVDGRFHFNAWDHPADRFNRIAFAQPLFALDNTGVPVNPARPINLAERRGWAYAGSHEKTNFELMVGVNGLR